MNSLVDYTNPSEIKYFDRGQFVGLVKATSAESSRGHRFPKSRWYVFSLQPELKLSLLNFFLLWIPAISFPKFSEPANKARRLVHLLISQRHVINCIQDDQFLAVARRLFDLLKWRHHLGARLDRNALERRQDSKLHGLRDYLPQWRPSIAERRPW